jgi:hypothetical protein
VCGGVGVSVAVPQNPNLQRPPPPPTQSVEEIQRLVQMARTVGPVQPSSIDTGEHQDKPYSPASTTLHAFWQFLPWQAMFCCQGRGQLVHRWLAAAT